MNIFKHISKHLILFLSIFLLAGCNSNQENEPVLSENPSEAREFLMGTYIDLRVYDEGKEDALEEAILKIEELDEKLSSNASGSEIDAINQAAGEEAVKVSEDVYPLIKTAAEYSSIPGSGFDYTIGAITDLWRIGFDDARVPSDDEIQAVLPLVSHEKVELNDEDKTVYLQEAGMKIDLGAIAKGYIADKVVEVFQEHGVTTAIIDLGGNVIVMGDSPIRDTGGFNVGVQDPSSSRGEIVGSINLKDKTAVTSGIYERFIEEGDKVYHHLMNPETGYPFENNLAGVTIITDKSVDGDVYSTVVFGFGLEKGLEYVNQQEGVEGIFVSVDKEIFTSDGLTDKFNLTDESYNWINE